MKNNSEYLEEIVRNLKSSKIYKIILFGSLAEEKQGKGSDIDLLIILDSNKISTTFKERLKNKMEIRKRIYDISQQIPIDLIVYTKAEYEILRESSSFIKKIEECGKVLYEKAGRILVENGE